MFAPTRYLSLLSLLLLPWGIDASASGDRLLSFLHTHTNQRITVTYYCDGAYVPEALEELNRFLFDFRILRDVALSMESGGVGYYPRSNFLHVDTGRVRRW